MNIEKIQQVIEDIKHNIKITLPLPAEILITSIRLILIVGLLSATDDGLIYLLLKACIRRVFFYQSTLLRRLLLEIHMDVWKVEAKGFHWMERKI